jgi:Flp pilus assembly protein, ATPase CpaF
MPLEDADLALIACVREELVQQNVTPPGWRDTDRESRRAFYNSVRSILIRQKLPTDAVNTKAQIITDALSGIGLLDQLLRDPDVEEVFVRNGFVAVEHHGTFYQLGRLADDRYFESLAIRVADQGGATLRGDRPAVLVDLPGGERFTAIVPKLSSEGTAINIRTFGRRIRTLEEMVSSGTFRDSGNTNETGFQTFSSSGEEQTLQALRERIDTLADAPAQFLAWMTATLAGSILIAGDMGSGKTTLLNALSGFLPTYAPIAALETFRELDIQHPFLLRTVAPAELAPGTPGVTLDWVLNVIYTRMNPAAIILGEIVGNEALEFLKAASLGRKAFSTIHGGSVEEALMRLEQLALAAAPQLGLPAIRSMIGMGLNAVVLMGRTNVGGRIQRSLRAIALIEGVDEAGRYRLQYLYLAGSQNASRLEAMYQTLQQGAPVQ